MKIVGILTVVANIATVYALQISPYKVYQVTNETTWGTETRIYGGDVAPEGRFPFMIFALMYTSEGIARCSASLIDQNWVLLAAHCIHFPGLSPENILLVGGKANLVEYVKARLPIPPSLSVDEKALGVQERRAKTFAIHPKYNPVTIYHDIALLRLDKPFDMPSISTISISTDKMNNPSQCTILGWGITPQDLNNYKLNYVNDKLVKTTALGCKYKESGPFICLKPRESGICTGDSGGPLVCGNKVWGVASHLVYDKSDECGESLEEYYSEIHPEVDWIHLYSNGNLSAVISFKNMILLIGFWLFLKNSMDIYKI